jgi:nucleoside-diphosphate-sugar epimerase
LRILWHADVHWDTVHVTDVCRAIWYVCTASHVPSGQVYHVTDEGSTTLGTLSDLTASLFEIKSSFVGKTLSMLAKVSEQFVDFPDDLNVIGSLTRWIWMA